MEMIFQTNSFETIKKETYRGTELYIMDNFFVDPDAVVNYLKQHSYPLHKQHLNPTHNGEFFFERRYQLKDDNFDSGWLESQSKFENLNVGVLQNPGKVLTNAFKLTRNEINDYKNNYWWPHTDKGYACVIYLNHYDGPGTNFYGEHSFDVFSKNENTHSAPWRSRKKYTLDRILNARYNRMVLFNGNKIMHSMALDDDIWFDEERLTIVCFFRFS
jgi:tRNA U38,U39,U40 pseudouridine synthase TruA